MLEGFETSLHHISGHPFASTFLKGSCREMSVFLYEEMLSVGLTLALIASLLLCQLTTQNADFAAVPARFWSNTFFTHQLLQFFLNPGLQENLHSLDEVARLPKLWLILVLIQPEWQVRLLWKISLDCR